MDSPGEEAVRLSNQLWPKLERQTMRYDVLEVPNLQNPES